MAFLHSVITAAADPGRGGQDPGGGLSALLIIGTVLAVAAIGVLLFTVFHRTARASRGGVQPRPDEFQRGEPPLESFGRRR